MEDRRFKKGQYMSYGTNGICLLEDITEMSFARGMEKNLYYILKPAAANASTIFVPVDNDALTAKMRPLMTKEEIDSLLLGMKNKAIPWEKDRQYRTENFHEILVKGVTEELLLMISCIYMKKRELLEQGKKLPATDSNTLKSAERLVEEEFSFVLGIEQESVSKYIRNVLAVPETADE